MIYKMTLKDSTDEMTFNLLEVPIVDKDIEGAVDNVTLDGNQYTDYLYLKKQYIQKWSIMCDEEYERLRGFYTRQFDEAEIPTYELYYGETIYNDYTLSGDYILADVQGVEPARMSLAQLDGNATQTTYSGKNLINGANLPSQAYSGSLTNSYYSQFDLGVEIEAGTQYTLSFYAENISVKPYNFSLGLGNTSYALDIANKNNISTTGDRVFITFTPSATQVSSAGGTKLFIRMPRYGTPTSFSWNISDYQLEKGGQMTSFEPYVGGIPAPNPEFPQPISIVTGEQTVKVLGKNLFDIDKLTATGITISDGTATGTSASFNTAFGLGGISLSLSEGQYTFSISGYTDGNQSTDGLGLGFRFRYTDGSYSAWTYWQNADLTLVNKTMTTASDKTPTALHIAFSSKAQNIWHLSNIQLEIGSTATSYQAYTAQDYPISLGELELAGVGEIQPDGLPKYRDTIKQIDGKWYIEKQVEKLNMNDLTSWSDRSAGDLYLLNFSDTYNAVIAECISNIFTYSATTWSGAGKFGIASSKSLWIMTGDTSVNSTNVSTWLANKNAVMYYALATPTTTEITNQTLIDQLEALVNVSIATGIHNIFTEVASGNLNPTMIFNFIEVVSQRVTLVPETPVRLTLTDGGIINACGCRKDVQLTMRETIE